MGSPGYHAKSFAYILLLRHSITSAGIIIYILQMRRWVREVREAIQLVRTGARSKLRSV